MLSLDELITLALRIKDRSLNYIGVDEEYDYESAGGDTSRAIDEAAEEELRSWLSEKKKFPDILSEETGLIKGEGRGILLIDPIDGSANADRGLPFSCVSIAYCKSYSLRDLELAVILDIFSGDLYYATRGQGCFLNGKRVKVRRLRGTPLIYAPCQEGDMLSKDVLGFKHIARRDFGSIALGLAYTASGKIDVLADLRGNLRIVDIAAGLLLVKEAEGYVYVNKLEVSGLNRELSVVAGSKELVDKIAVESMVPI